MKLSVLVDNNTLTDQYFYGEPALAFWIENAKNRILFDTGYSDVCFKNAEKLGVSVASLTHLVLSHGHNDHTGGLPELMQKIDRLASKPMLIGHPDVLKAKWAQQESIGLSVNIGALQKTFCCNFTRQPLQLDEQMFFLGEIPSYFDFESRVAIGECCQEDGEKEKDLLFDDSALVYKLKSGLVIITGCSHSGICNIIKYAQEICKDKRIVDVIGGFHLLDASAERMNSTIDFFKKTMPLQLHACHCTDLAAKIALGKCLPLHEVGSGLQLYYERKSFL